MSEQGQKVQIGKAVIKLQNVQLRGDALLDEVQLEGGDITFTPSDGAMEAKVSAGETRFQVTVSEPNINRLLSANLPPDAPVRELKFASLSGKARLSGRYVKFGIGLPFTLEAVPRIENGQRVWLDCQSMNVVVGSLPEPVLKVIEQVVNNNLNLDLAQSPVPVYLAEIRCEPGRVTVLGRARISWPLATTPSPLRPFSAPAALPSVESAPTPEALLPAGEG